MFIGHYAVALAAKKAAPGVSLGTLFLAAQFVDLLWPLFLILGIEHVRIEPGNTAYTPLDFYDYPISHSLAGAVLWGAGFGTIYFLVRRNGRNALIAGLCVVSHWVLDFITHRPDLPLGFSGGERFGAGLWNSVPATLAVETSLFLAGVGLYVAGTRGRDRIGIIGFWSLIAVLLLISAGNLLGPPPPDVRSLALVANAAWLFVAWAFWVDRHRQQTDGA
jgi:hypothetical protein